MRNKAFSRTVAIILAIVTAVPLLVFGASASEKNAQADAINALRGSGQLIIYTPTYGASTGTNEWGYEAVIENNRCISVGGGNNAIPSNGFVVSGHNEDEGGKQMGVWIEKNIKIGDYVYYNEASLTVTVSSEPIKESNFYSVSTAYNGINITRSENYTVIYNTLGALTGTNEFGYEVVVKCGYVVSVGGNNNRVPAAYGSFVVSAHGTAIDWLKRNARVGMAVTYDDKTITFEFNEKSVTSGIDTLLENIDTAISTARKNYLIIDYSDIESKVVAVSEKVNACKEAHKNGKDPEGFATEIGALYTEAETILNSICESRTVEYRGVWLRPTQTSAAQVDEYVETLYNNGINTVCIETLYDCCMIMPMPEDSLFSVNPKFKHFDLLASYIESCHKRGMELHIWMPVFYVGNSESSNASLSVGVKKPEWLSVSSNGGSAEDAEGFYMLDPANGEVQDFLLSTYKYILETYDIDAFHLDYIRYYSNYESKYDWGYSDIAIKEFEAQFGYVPEYNTSASYWNDWSDYRCGKVTLFVSRVRKLFDEVKPDCLLGADVAGNPSSGKKTVYQDYYTWLDNGWLDIVFPMSYGTGYESAILEQKERCGNKSFIAVGLGIFMEELDAVTMRSQVEYNNSVNTTGSCFFEASSYLNKNTGEYLKKTIYRESALAPNFDISASFKEYLNTAEKRITEVIIPLGGASEEAAGPVLAAISELKSAGYSAEGCRKLTEALEGAGFDEAAFNAVAVDIENAAKLYAVAEKNAELPELPDTPSYTVSAEESASEEDNISSVSEKTESNGTKVVVIIAVVLALSAVIAAAATVIIKKKGNK